MRYILTLALATTILASCLLSTPVFAQPDDQVSAIDWRVSNRFRLWDQARSRGELDLERLLDGVNSSSSPTELYSLLTKFLADHPTLHTQSYWLDGEEIYDRNYIWAEHYTVTVRAPAFGSQLCSWTVPELGVNEQSTNCDQPRELQIPADGTGTGSQQIDVQVVTQDGSRAQTTIRVRDRLIASIGDSFASGEGNPDRPTDLTRVSEQFRQWDSDWVDRWPGREAVIGQAGAALWWDSRCHRSFMSQHMVGALRFAAARPQEAVTFVTYACSGAETFNGLLAVQARPPGYRDSRLARVLNYPQVEVLIANMCRSRSVAGPRLSYPVNGRWVHVPTYVCDAGDPRRPIDILLVSIGGNDVGFAPVIQDALLPRRDQARNLGRVVLSGLRRLGTRTPDEAQRLIENQLPENYQHLRGRISQVVSPDTAVFQTVYPNPLQAEDGSTCGRPASYIEEAPHPHSTALTAFAGFWPDRRVREDRRWRFNFDQAQGDVIERSMVRPLNAAVQANAAAAGWTLVSSFERSFDGRGWCAADTNVKSEGLGLPNWDPDQRRWVPWSPSEWRPYDARLRLFRTPNDAVLTQQPANPRPTFGRFQFLFGRAMERQQDALLAAMAGSFHPTFEAHTIIGWSLGEALNEATLPGHAPGLSD